MLINIIIASEVISSRTLICHPQKQIEIIAIISSILSIYLLHYDLASITDRAGKSDRAEKLKIHGHLW